MNPARNKPEIPQGVAVGLAIGAGSGRLTAFLLRRARAIYLAGSSKTMLDLLRARKWLTAPLLMLITLVAAVPRIYRGATDHIDFDGYWHVFIAMQDNWEIFKEEYRANWHPPLYYLLLKVSLWFGRSALIYRAVSILAGVAAVFVIGKIVEKLSLRRATPAIAALAYGFALPSIMVSVEARSYMLCVFFVLASFYYFLDILDGHRHARARIGFAIFAMCAVASHYSAFFYVSACVLIAAALDVRLFRRPFAERLVLDLATFLPLGGFVAWLYYTHVRGFGRASGHLGEFYFVPGVESLSAFLLRNAQNLFNSFSPVSIETPVWFMAVLSGLILAGGAPFF
jgi:4-amino-4-deoxy-L-arabinose transferase-like glycosyltransferase